MADICIHAWVSGRVQGVWFRQTTLDEADRRGLRGWVRNLDDGRVEVKVCGDEKAVCQLEAWLSQGPELANVAEVVSEREEDDPTLVGFEIR